METKTHFEEDVLGDFGFRVVFSYTEYWCDVEAYEIVDRDEKSLFFQRKDADFSPDCVESISEAEKYLSGYIKWDGCSELDQGCPHWCGPDCYIKHIKLLEYVYRKAMQLMCKDDEWPST